MLNQVKENDIILKEGDKDENLYKILNGKVVVYNGYGSDKETVIGILSAGSYFGELGVFAGEPSVYTVVAYDDALILSVDKEDLRTYLKQNDSDSYEIMSNMSKAMLMMKKNIET